MINLPIVYQALGILLYLESLLLAGCMCFGLWAGETDLLMFGVPALVAIVLGILLRAGLVPGLLRTLEALLLRAGRTCRLRTRLILAALRARLASGLRVLRGCCGLGLLCGRRSGRFLLCRGSGKDLLDRIDLVLLRDIVENHVQLVFR